MICLPFPAAFSGAYGNPGDVIGFNELLKVGKPRIYGPSSHRCHIASRSKTQRLVQKLLPGPLFIHTAVSKPLSLLLRRTADPFPQYSTKKQELKKRVDEVVSFGHFEMLTKQS